MNILFWNTGLSKNREGNSKRIIECIQEILIENSVDLLILAEYPYDTQTLCTVSSALSAIQYKSIPNYSKSYRIRGIINSKYNIESLQEQSRYQLVKINTSYYTLIVAMVHGKDKWNNDASTREEGISIFSKDIYDHEQKHNCKYSIAIGDFNMDPFERSCIGSSGMHAIPFVDSVVKSSRIVNEREYQKFYNPTWKLFGNEKAPYTTYHLDRTGQVENFYWYALDQVIIRPALIEAFDEKKLEIITQTKSHNLLMKGKPNKDSYSDHLPLICCLKEDLM